MGLQTVDFNYSELNAYKASIALTNYLSQLHVRYPGYRLNILAHSQGNAIVGEAIANGASFDTYILTQGAMPASCYDVNSPFYSGLTNAEAIVPTPQSEPMGYVGLYTNSYFTGRIINFYNGNDPVLSFWLLDQLELKPNEFYAYVGANSYHVIEDGPTLLVTDPQESRAMVARSLTLPIGQSGPVSGHGVIQSAIDLHAEFGFNLAFPNDHSSQWTWPIQRCWGYYDDLLESCLIPTIQRQ